MGTICTQEEWANRANSLISVIYRKMAQIDVNDLGLQDANRKRNHLQGKLNKIGKIAGKRGQLRLVDGYEWLRDGSRELKPRLPLPLK